MSVIDAFLDEHRRHPWPVWMGDYDPAARAMFAGIAPLADADAGAEGAGIYGVYVAYVAALGDPSLRTLGQPELGAELKSRPWTGHIRFPEGVVYRGLSIESRAQRAESEVRRSMFWDDIYGRLRDASMERHVASCQRPECDHQPPVSAVERLLDAATAEIAAMVLTPDQQAEVDRLVEERYGPFLRWRDGDPIPAVDDQWEVLRPLTFGPSDQSAEDVDW